MKKALLSVLILVLAVSQFHSAVFRFGNEPGRKIRFKNLVKQDIYQNGAYYKSVDMMSKAMLENVSSANRLGFYKGKYYFYEKNVNLNESFKLKNIYESEFTMDEQGRMKVSPGILMPTIRSIPTFPTNDLKPGDSWSAEGEELQEGILDRSHIVNFKTDVYYKYLGDEQVNGTWYSEFAIDYHVIHYPKGDPEIFSLTGFSHMQYYWDISNSSPAFYNEEYAFMFTLRNGETVYYTGGSESKVDYVSDITNQQKQAIMNEISNTIPKNSGITVKEVADGIVVNLGNILFDINKATLKKEYEQKLASVTEVLRKYSQIDLTVSGHTDNTGTEQYNRVLSENRAKTVSDFLMKKGIAATRISYIGYGLTRPVAPNDTEEGRQLNRRVEIKLITKE